MRHYVKNLAAAILFATATASAQPINDDFADRIRVIGLQLRLSGNNLGATSESGEPVPFYPAGHRSVWSLMSKNRLLPISRNAVRRPASATARPST